LQSHYCSNSWRVSSLFFKENRRRTCQLHQQGVFGVEMSTSAAYDVPKLPIGMLSENKCGQLNRENKVATPVRIPQDTYLYIFAGVKDAVKSKYY
jgi:hypothetical protein